MISVYNERNCDRDAAAAAAVIIIMTIMIMIGVIIDIIGRNVTYTSFVCVMVWTKMCSVHVLK